MNIDEAVMFLKLLAGDVRTIDIKCRTEKEVKKVFERATFLAKQIEQLTEALENV